MASRQRLTNFTFSSNGGGPAESHSNAQRASDLERKLELLEARFTMPLNFQPHTNHSTGSCINNNENSNSPATLDAENSSPVSIQSSTVHEQSNQHRLNDSQQSFAFDTPSMLNVSNHYFNQQENMNLVPSSPNRAINHVHEPMKSNVVDRSHASQQWEAVTAQHIARKQNEHQMQYCNDSQQHTIQTSHVKDSSTATLETDATKIQSSTATSPKTHIENFTKVVQEKQQTVKAHAMLKLGENKRKPTNPIKRQQHSVKDSIPCTDSGATISEGPESTSTINQSKRTRLNFDPVECAPTSAYHDIGDDDAPSTLSLSRSPISSRNACSTKSNSPRRLTQNKHKDKPDDDRELLISHSREPLNPSSGKLNISKALAAITNNSKISDFFSITSKKRATETNGSTKEAEGSKENNTSSYLEQSLTSSMVQAIDLDRTNRSIRESTNRISPDVSAIELEVLKKQYEELQRLCHDKDEQLKAVSNNRTILHTALQAALRQREQELETLQNETEEKFAKYRDTLEELVRADACQEAREIREKLATDGARLGCIKTIPTPTTKGPSRMLMHHRATLESWEDGYATKELQQSIKDVQAKKAVYEDRLKAALSTEEAFYAKMNIVSPQGIAAGAPSNEELSNDVETGISEAPPKSILDVRESIESVRYHLRNIRQKEKELALAEQTLNDQKGAHIRALKRVASEDASRFRSRPKLNDRYVLRSLLGKGGFSEVWLAFDLVELREVAVKIHQLDSRWPDAKKENYTKHVSREYEIHRSVRHPRIVSLYDVFEIDNNSFATVLEACEGTDLDTMLKIKRYLSEREARAILLQILCGMNYLSHPSADGSRQGIIHYDLKPGNVLFDQFGDAKITDFGLSKIVDSHDPAESMELTSQGAGTYWYLPPECFILEDNVRISNKVDVWSIGVIFFQMLFGKRPFGDGQSQDRMLANGTMLNAHTLNFPARPEVSKSCRDFIEACLTYDQRFRPTMAQICEHPYVTSREFDE